jgi:hypothetical protein
MLGLCCVLYVDRVEKNVRNIEQGTQSGRKRAAGGMVLTHLQTTVTDLGGSMPLAGWFLPTC